MSNLQHSRLIGAWTILKPMAEEIVSNIEREALNADTNVLDAHFMAKGARRLLNTLATEAAKAQQSIGEYGNHTAAA